MNDFGLADAVNLYNTKKSMINGLWAVYVAATFAASGFSFSGFGSTEIFAKVFLTIGFWAFAIGHLGLLWQSLGALDAIRNDISS